MKTKALTRMRNDTENKKSRADPFGMTSWNGFLFFATDKYTGIYGFPIKNGSS